MNIKKIIALVGMVLMITALHYSTAIYRGPLHILYRELYFIPIILAGLWGGKKSGLIMSIIITVIYLPHVLILATSNIGYHHMTMGPVTDVANTTMGNVSQMLLFNVAGFFAGTYSDLKRSYFSTKSRSYHPVKFKKNFLLCVEESPSSLYAAKYLADVFGSVPDVGVTAFWVSSGVDPDYFKTSEELTAYKQEHHKNGESLLGRVKDILVQGGFDEGRIELKTLATDKNKRISDELMEQIKVGDFNTIVVGNHHLTKSQEFLFGSVAINLVRKAPVNVLTVKAPEEAERGQSVQEPG